PDAAAHGRDRLHPARHIHKPPRRRDRPGMRENGDGVLDTFLAALVLRGDRFVDWRRADGGKLHVIRHENHLHVGIVFVPVVKNGDEANHALTRDGPAVFHDQRFAGLEAYALKGFDFDVHARVSARVFSSRAKMASSGWAASAASLLSSGSSSPERAFGGVTSEGDFSLFNDPVCGVEFCLRTTGAPFAGAGWSNLARI